MMKRIDNLEFINKILTTENAKAIEEDNLLIDSDLDSFGYAILFIELDTKFGGFNKEYLNNIDYKTYTMKDLLDKITTKKIKLNKCIKKIKKYKNRSKNVHKKLFL